MVWLYIYSKFSPSASESLRGSVWKRTAHSSKSSRTQMQTSMHVSSAREIIGAHISL
uniref:Uncharacterized protein n=1 Tax=Anguilla anguilla TaxID=7936 RepID=A0A0E9P9U5_ANGAN